MNFDLSKTKVESQLKSIVVWTLFTVAIMRVLELVDVDIIAYLYIYPGLFNYSFLYYHLLKTGRFPGIGMFSISIVFISIFYHIIIYTISKYVRLTEDLLQIEYMHEMFVAGLTIAIPMYLLTFLIKESLNS